MKKKILKCEVCGIKNETVKVVGYGNKYCKPCLDRDTRRRIYAHAIQG